MGVFLNSLHVEQVESTTHDYRGMWKVLEPFSFLSDVARMIITVPEGFLTDFQSCPRLPLVYWLFGSISNESATLHDYLYQSNMLPRPIADKVFLEAMKSKGVPAWRRYAIYAGVAFFGWIYYS